MAWLLLAGLVFFLMLRFEKRHRALFTVLPSESISTIHMEMTRKHTAKKGAALAAAIAALR